MKWSFDPTWFAIGIAVTIAGILIVRFHQAIANNLASGVSSYGKVKLFGIIACVLGMLMACNLHTTLLLLIFNLIMPN